MKHVTEVNLRRLLAKCQQDVEGEPPQGEELVIYQTNINYLRSLLEQLRADGNLDQTSVYSYADQIDRLADLIDPDKLLLPVEKAMSKRRRPDLHNGSIEAIMATHRELKAQRHYEGELRNHLFSTKKAPEIVLSERRSHADERSDLLGEGMRRRDRSREPAADLQDNQQFERILANQRQDQEQLTEDLLSMAKNLKSNALTFGELLKKDAQVLEEAENALSTNIAKVTKEGGRLKTLRDASRTTTWLTWGAVLFVCIVFALTYMFIRIAPRPR